MNGKSPSLLEPLRARFLRWLALAVGFKVLYATALLWALAGWGEIPEHTFRLTKPSWPREGGPTFASHWATWDTAHYLYLCEEGYGPGIRSVAFYPLWPLGLRAAAPVFGSNPLVAGLVLTNVCSFAAWALVYERVRRRWGTPVAGWTLVLLVAYPGSLFFQFPYTESLFLLLVGLLWWGLEERRTGLVWTAGLLLPLTRAVGVFAVLPIAGQALREAPPAGLVRLGMRARDLWNGLSRRVARRGAKPVEEEAEVGKAEMGRRKAGEEITTGLGAASACRRSAGERRSGRGFPLTPWGLVAAPLAGWGLYLGLMWHWTGHPFEGFAAQRYWGVHTVSNLWDVPKFVTGFFSPTEWHEFRGSLLDRLVFVLVLYTLPVLWRLDRGLLVWTYWLAILPAMSGTFTSYTRFASCAFPVFVALAHWLNPDASRPGSAVGVGHSRYRGWLKWGVLAGFLALHGVLVWRFVNFRWAG